MNQCRVKHRCRNITLIEKHAHLRAPQDQAIGPCIGKAIRNCNVRGRAVGAPYVFAKLLIDDAMCFCLVGSIRKDRGQARGNESIGIE